jgi:nicotinate-nucleotide adenylyltransferase
LLVFRIFFGTTEEHRRIAVMRLGILGGSFDPVHYGHLLLAESAREQCQLDQVWLLPAAVPPHKQDRQLTSAEHRVAMLELAIAGETAFSVCRYEVDRGGINYTYETLERIKNEQPDWQLFFVLGADMLHDLPHWREPSRICQLAILVVVARPGFGEPDYSLLSGITTPERIDLMRRHRVVMPQVGISSSDLRRRIAQGRSIRFRTPRAVEEYIRTHGLYQQG